MILRTLRLDRGSVILISVIGSDLDQDLDDRKYLLDAFRCLGVNVVMVPDRTEFTILSGPGHPIEIGPVGPPR